MKLNIKSLNYSTILTICLIVVLTILGELSESFKTFLTSITGHHWVTKGVFSSIFFVIIYFLISRTNKDGAELTRQVIYTIIAAVLSAIIIFWFYVLHFVS